VERRAVQDGPPRRHPVPRGPDRRQRLLPKRGGTRRQGAELGLSGGWKRLTYFVSYAYVAATYETSETLASVTEASGVRVRPGDRIPGIPEHNVKVGAEVEVLKRFWVGADVIATSGTYLRGDDGNQRAPVNGYALLNLHARYQPIKPLELWARVDNATNTDYATTGALNFNAFASPIAVERFVAPRRPDLRLGRCPRALLRTAVH
jgi:iron complex outermembrane recepter protein